MVDLIDVSVSRALFFRSKSAEVPEELPGPSRFSLLCVATSHVSGYVILDSQKMSLIEVMVPDDVLWQFSVFKLAVRFTQIDPWSKHGR